MICHFAVDFHQQGRDQWACRNYHPRPSIITSGICVVGDIRITVSTIDVISSAGIPEFRDRFNSESIGPVDNREHRIKLFFSENKVEYAKLAYLNSRLYNVYSSSNELNRGSIALILPTLIINPGFLISFHANITSCNKLSCTFAAKLVLTHVQFIKTEISGLRSKLVTVLRPAAVAKSIPLAREHGSVLSLVDNIKPNPTVVPVIYIIKVCQSFSPLQVCNFAVFAEQVIRHFTVDFHRKIEVYV